MLIHAKHLPTKNGRHPQYVSAEQYNRLEREIARYTYRQARSGWPVRWPRDEARDMARRRANELLAIRHEEQARHQWRTAGIITEITHEGVTR